MNIELPVSGTKALKAVYVDAAGNPTSPPEGAQPFAWTASDPSVGTLDTAAGPDVTLTAVGALATSETLSVTDGTLTSIESVVTIVAGPAVGIDIVPA